MDAVRLATKTGDKWTAQTLAGQAATLAEGSQVPHRQANALYCRGLIDRDAAVLLEAAQRSRTRGGRSPGPRPSRRRPSAWSRSRSAPRPGSPSSRPSTVYEFLGAEADLNRVNAEFRVHGIRRGPHSKHRRAHQRLGVADRHRAQGRGARRGGALQPGDRRPAGALPPHGHHARLAHTQEARRRDQDRDRPRVGPARPRPPSKRPHRAVRRTCSSAGTGMAAGNTRAARRVRVRRAARR